MLAHHGYEVQPQHGEGIEPSLLLSHGTFHRPVREQLRKQQRLTCPVTILLN